MSRLYITLALVGFVVSAAQGQNVIVDETFDYADEAAFHAVWGGIVGNPPGTGTPADVETRFELVTETPSNADFNGDTIVNAADYTIWRDNLGLSGAATQGMGDANGDMNVNQTDYDLWKSTFGSTPSGGGGTNKYVRHLANQSSPNTVPDGSLEYLLPLDPNYQPDNSIYPSDGLEPIVLRADIYAESAVLQRNVVGLRSTFGSAQNLFEMGFFNGTGSQGTLALDHPEWGAAYGANADCVVAPSQACAGFGVRAQLFTASPVGNPDWQFFKFDESWDTNGNGLVSATEVFTALGGPGWHRFEATISADPEGDHHDVVITVDLLADGINNATGESGVDATITYDDVFKVTDAGFDTLRIGGPSSLYTIRFAQFDNVYLSGPVVQLGAGGLAAVPEPASASIVLISMMIGWALGGRRYDWRTA